MYVQLQMKFERDISVKIKGHTPLVTLPPLVQPKLALRVLPPREVFDVVFDLRRGGRLTLLVACGRLSRVTVNCVMRQFHSTEGATVSTVAVDQTVVALLTGVSEATELELDEDMLCAFQVAILKFYEKARDLSNRAMDRNSKCS